MKSLAEVLSDDNRALLRVITQAQPDSIARLAEITGRKPSNLSRTPGSPLASHPRIPSHRVIISSSFLRSLVASLFFTVTEVAP